MVFPGLSFTTSATDDGKWSTERGRRSTPGRGKVLPLPLSPSVVMRRTSRDGFLDPKSPDEGCCVCVCGVVPRRTEWKPNGTALVLPRDRRMVLQCVYSNRTLENSPFFHRSVTGLSWEPGTDSRQCVQDSPTLYQFPSLLSLGGFRDG